MSGYPISVVVVCFNEVGNIRSCIESILKQSIDRFELILVDNNSNDGTLEIIKEYKFLDSRIKIVINPVRGIAISRNIGIKEASFPFIAFVDADCEVPTDWLEVLLNGFIKYENDVPNLVAVGGSNIPPSNNSQFYDALSLFLNSFLGSRGSVQGMVFDSDVEVDHLPCVNVMYKKEIVSKIGGFDERFLFIGEDQDITYRMLEKGYKFYYLRKSYVIHKLRDNLGKWIINMFVYGKGRMWLIRKHHKMRSLAFMAPILLVIGILLSPFYILSNMFLLPLLYFPLILVYSIYIAIINKQLRGLFSLFILYCGTHLAYGAGEIYGFFVNPEVI